VFVNVPSNQKLDVAVPEVDTSTCKGTVFVIEEVLEGMKYSLVALVEPEVFKDKVIVVLD
jgi:hypothetical protein